MLKSLALFYSFGIFVAINAAPYVHHEEETTRPDQTQAENDVILGPMKVVYQRGMCHKLQMR